MCRILIAFSIIILSGVNTYNAPKISSSPKVSERNRYRKIIGISAHLYLYINIALKANDIVLRMPMSGKYRNSAAAIMRAGR